MTATALKPASAAKIIVSVIAAVVFAAAAMVDPAVRPLAGLVVLGGEFMAHLRIDGLGLPSVVAVVMVFFFSGIAGGFSGFAFTAVAAGILWLLPPSHAILLMLLLSACNQLLLLRALRAEHAICNRSVREEAQPHIVGGLAGLLIGLLLLQILPDRPLSARLGAILAVYSVTMFVTMLMKAEAPGVAPASQKAAAAIGAAGGVLGVVAGLISLLPAAYWGLRGGGKSAIRGATPPYTVTVQLVSLGVLGTSNTALFNGQIWLLAALALPAVLLGSATGVAVYRRTNDLNFRWATLILLVLSGFSLLAKAMI